MSLPSIGPRSPLFLMGSALSLALKERSKPAQQWLRPHENRDDRRADCDDGRKDRLPMGKEPIHHSILTQQVGKLSNVRRNPSRLVEPDKGDVRCHQSPAAALPRRRWLRDQSRSRLDR